MSQQKTKHRILFNADCNWPFMQAPDPVTPDGVARVVDAVADAGADVFLANANGQMATYPSRARERLWDRFVPGDLEPFRLGEGDAQFKHDLVLKMRRLNEQWAATRWWSARKARRI